MNISDLIPEKGLEITNYKRKQFIEKIGEETVKEVVTGILCGQNVRDLTEEITRRRLAISNGAMLVLFLKAISNHEDFINKMPELVNSELFENLSRDKKSFLIWLIGLTQKGVQNILRSDEKGMQNYLVSFKKALDTSASKCNIEYGEIKSCFEFEGKEILLDWPSLLYLFAAIGAQTLTIRGSEKSGYGKLFERLVLGSLLSILGFNFINKKDASKFKKVFWLSSKGDKRESDATLLYRQGIGVRFDIGFIGPGNTEISLDKVSRFQKEVEIGRNTFFMSTIIIVDRIGQKSNIIDLANEIDGHIVQMSMSHWVKEVCLILNKSIKFTHPILNKKEHQISKYISKKMQGINLKQFL